MNRHFTLSICNFTFYYPTVLSLGNLSRATVSEVTAINQLNLLIDDSAAEHCLRPSDYKKPYMFLNQFSFDVCMAIVCICIYFGV